MMEHRPWLAKSSLAQPAYLKTFTVFLLTVGLLAVAPLLVLANDFGLKSLRPDGMRILALLPGGGFRTIHHMRRYFTSLYFVDAQLCLQEKHEPGHCVA